MAARPHRREERRQVVGEVVLGGRPGPSAARPGPEGQLLGHLPRPVLGPYAHHRRVERVRRPRGPRIGAVVGRREDAAGVQLRPRRLPGRAPARGAAQVQRRIRERGHQDRAQQVRQPPAPSVAERAGLLVARVHADLHGGGAAHHGPPGRTAPVEVGLHGVVARLAQQAARRVPGVLAVSGERDPEVAQRGPGEREVMGGVRHAGGEGFGGQRAELQLTAGLEGERRSQRQGAGPGGGRSHPGRRHGTERIVQVVQEPFEFDPDPARWPGLEADAVHEILGLGLRDGSRGVLPVRHALCLPSVAAATSVAAGRGAPYHLSHCGRSAQGGRRQDPAARSHARNGPEPRP